MSVSVVNAVKCGVQNLIETLVSIKDEIVAAIQGSVTPDYELNDSGWLCDVGGTNTWVRTLTPYVDGVAGTPQVVDSGIACDQPAPSNPVVDTELVCNTTTGFYDLVTVVTTDGVAAAPVFLATTTTCTRDSFQLSPIETICATVDGGEFVQLVPAIVFNQNTNAPAGVRYFDREGAEVTGVIVKGKDCDCGCEDCGSCILMDGFDVDRGIVTPGDTTTFVLTKDTVVEATVVHDYTTSSDGVNVSSFYVPIIAAINAIAGWAIVLETDVAIADQGKPTWRVEYTGSGASQLIIDKDGGGSVLTLDADGSGSIVGTTNWGTDSFPFAECS